METVKIRLTGTAPILIHSDRLANPLDPLTKAKKAVATKRKKTDEDHAELAKMEWEGALYYDEKIGPFMPGRNIKAMLISAAKKTKDGVRAKTGLIVSEDKIKILYSGPREIGALWADGRFTDIRCVGQMKVRIMRCRPIFPEWTLEFSVIYDPSVVDKSDILRFADAGGRLVGLGDYRVECCGDFGRFEAEEIK